MVRQLVSKKRSNRFTILFKKAIRSGWLFLLWYCWAKTELNTIEIVENTEIQAH
jgi:hypothetical protein